jgi:hypothetical protein
VLYRDPDTGGVDLVFDPTDARTVYAVMWETRQGPWENGAFAGPGSGIFKSIDGGDSWRPLTDGLPTFEADGLGRIGIDEAVRAAAAGLRRAVGRAGVPGGFRQRVT